MIFTVYHKGGMVVEAGLITDYPRLKIPENAGTVEIDYELNLDLCSDIKNNIGKVDKNRNNKYYISGGELQETDNWQEFIWQQIGASMPPG